MAWIVIFVTFIWYLWTNNEFLMQYLNSNCNGFFGSNRCRYLLWNLVTTTPTWLCYCKAEFTISLWTLPLNEAKSYSVLFTPLRCKYRVSFTTTSTPRVPRTKEHRDQGTSSWWTWGTIIHYWILNNNNNIGIFSSILMTLSSQ